VPRILALLPAVLLASAAVWTGGFESATRVPAGAVGLAAILCASLLAFRDLPDPLALGRLGGVLPPLVVAFAAVSWAASPVPRAGRLALVLLPAFLLLPAAVARAWREPAARRLGVAGVGVAVAAVGAIGIFDSAGSAWRKAAEPLGHHNLLAVFLVVTLPLAAVGLRERGWERSVAASALVAGLGALALTRSLAAFGAFFVVALVGSRGLPRGRDLALGLALLALAAALPRAERIARGEDSSTRARAVYARAALTGALERPWRGWGPGATPWTIAGSSAPRPGVNPPGELVGEPHSTPLRLLYELGFPGAICAAMLLALFGWRRWRDRGVAADRPLLAASLAGVAAGALASLGNSWLSVPALPLALAVAAGGALAGGPAKPRGRGTAGAVVLAGYASFAIWVALPLVRAQAAYASAAASEDADFRRRALERARALDPEFPLYAARAAWELPGESRGAATEAIRAAQSGRGLEPLWLKAGALALEAGAYDLATPALERALFLDPLSAGPPFALFAASKGAEVDCAARAFLAEPKLASALAWRGNEDARRFAIRRVVEWPGIDAGWREEFARQAWRAGPGASPVERDVVYRIDRSPAASASLHLLRREPWPAVLLRIRIDAGAAKRIAVPAASTLELSTSEAFPRRSCRPG